MFLLLILPILVSGYIVFRCHPYYIYRLHRFDGQLLYIGCAKLGLLCSIVGFLIVLLLNYYLPPHWRISKTIIVDLDVIAFFERLISPLVGVQPREVTVIFLCGISSLITAYLWSKLAKYWLWLAATEPKIRLKFWFSFFKYRRTNLFAAKRAMIGLKKLAKIPPTSKYQIALMSNILLDSPIDKIFLESFLDDIALIFVLDDRRVYVGLVTSLGEPNESEGMDQEICIAPYLSGYLDKDTLEIKYQTRTKKATEELVIRQDNITSATKFNEQVFASYTKANMISHLKEEF